MIIGKKLFTTSLLALFFAVGAFLFLYPYTDGVIVQAHDVILIDRVSDSDDLARGLGGRASLCQRCGMLFVFDEKYPYSFWMKDMHFDIDIIWLDDGRVVHVEKGVSHLTPEKTYTPIAPANVVLELPAGRAEELGIEEGVMMSY